MDSKQRLEKAVDSLNKLSGSSYSMHSGHIEDSFVISILNNGRTIVTQNNVGLTEDQCFDLVLQEVVKLGIIYAKDINDKYAPFT